MAREIKGDVFIPIVEFGDWLQSYPLFVADELPIRASYGLWAFCAGCKYKYSNGVVAMFPTLSDFGEKAFSQSRSPESKQDFEALMERRCPKCGDSNLIAIMSDIPSHVREAYQFRI